VTNDRDQVSGAIFCLPWRRRRPFIGRFLPQRTTAAGRAWSRFKGTSTKDSTGCDRIGICARVETISATFTGQPARIIRTVRGGRCRRGQLDIFSFERGASVAHFFGNFRAMQVPLDLLPRSFSLRPFTGSPGAPRVHGSVQFQQHAEESPAGNLKLAVSRKRAGLPQQLGIEKQMSSAARTRVAGRWKERSECSLRRRLLEPTAATLKRIR